MCSITRGNVRRNFKEDYRLPLMLLSLSRALSTTQRLCLSPSALLYSPVCSSHLQLLGRHNGTAQFSDIVLFCCPSQRFDKLETKQVLTEKKTERRENVPAKLLMGLTVCCLDGRLNRQIYTKSRMIHPKIKPSSYHIRLTRITQQITQSPQTDNHSLVCKPPFCKKM